jgi:pimeloyl-ACP methyl ester carboxylesterase
MKPIVLVHGLIGSLSNPEILDAFEHRRVHAPDLLGYGADAARRTNWTLLDQADHVAAFIRGAERGPVHIVGHSAGGAVAILLALRYRSLVNSVTSVEGNFTLADAFWSLKFAKMPLHEVETQLVSYRANPTAWLDRAGVPATPWTLSVAKASLAHQPATTLQIQSKAVVSATERASFLEGVRQLLNEEVPLHLVAGSRSSSSWGVPDWVRQRAASDIELPDSGHLMMLEDRVAFAHSIVSPLD